jgi:two-component system, OmpR family, response regulator RpaA
MAKILVVDDDPSVARVIQLALQAKGHEVLTAHSMEEGEAAAVENIPDLMIVDVMMPRKTEGFHLVMNIRKSESEFRNVPIIMVTAIHEDPGWAYGPSEFLPVQEWLGKPVRVEELLEKVEKVLRK